MDEEQSKKIDSDEMSEPSTEGSGKSADADSKVAVSPDLEQRMRAVHAAQERRRQEEAFFDPDQIDPELMELAKERSRGSLLRPILMIAVIAFGLSLLNDWRDPLEYFFTSSTPIEMGNVTEYPLEIARNPEWTPPLVHNRYVTIQGVPTRRSQSAQNNYFKLAGAEVYVESPRDDVPKSAITRVMSEGSPKKASDTDRTSYSGAGRLIALSKTTDRYGGLRNYYASRYNMHFCEQYDERGLAELARSRRETILSNWALEYEMATPEERSQRGLRPEPTSEEFDAIFNLEPLCVHAYLFQEGMVPRNHWWYLALALLIGGFIIYNVINLVRWTIRFVKP